MKVKLREYRQGDLDAMYALDLVCFEPVFRFSLRAMCRFAEARGAVTILAETDDADAGKVQLAGFCIVQMEELIGYVVTLDVAPAWRRQGLARTLMEQVEAKIQADGGVGMKLHVFVGNLGAVRFYEGMGYKQAGTVKGFYARGMDALVYAKRFTA